MRIAGDERVGRHVAGDAGLGRRLRRGRQPSHGRSHRPARRASRRRRRSCCRRCRPAPRAASSCRPRTPCAICTRLSILVPGLIRVSPTAGRSIVVFAPISTSSSITTVGDLRDLLVRAVVACAKPKPSLPMTAPSWMTHARADRRRARGWRRARAAGSRARATAPAPITACAWTIVRAPMRAPALDDDERVRSTTSSSSDRVGGDERERDERPARAAPRGYSKPRRAREGEIRIRRREERRTARRRRRRLTITADARDDGELRRRISGWRER